MNKTTRKISLCAILTALAVIFIYISAIMPTGQLGFSAIASIFVIASIIECGTSGGIFVYVCSSILGLLLVPEKVSALIFVLFLGYYPLIKMVAEKLKSRILEWVLKLAVMNVALFVLLFLFSVTILNFDYISNSYLILIILVNVVFIIYDIALSRAIRFYMYRISPKLKKK